jgi:HK97 family phage prohead protease
MAIANKLERRIYTSGMELRSVDGKTMIAGMAAVFNTLSRDLGGFREQILPGAFDGCDMSDVQCLFNHNGDQILARLFEGEGTLSLSVTDSGLAYEFEKPNHSVGEYLAEAIARRDIRHSSFAFTVADDTWVEDKEQGFIRSIKKFRKLYDVSPVNNPAYWATEVDTRSLDEFKKTLHPVAERTFSAQYFDRLRLEHYKK